MAAAVMYRATGKRKTSVARVILSPGVGRTIVNGREIDEYFGRKVLQTVALMPFETTHTSGKFDVKVSEDPLILESETALKNYDIIVFTIYAQKLGELPGQAQENLLNYVKGGKGFFVQHLATASFPKWEEFGKLCGRKWVMRTSGHGPRAENGEGVLSRNLQLAHRGPCGCSP